MLRCDCTPSANRNGPRQTGRGRWSLGPGGLQRKRLTGSSGWPRHGRQPGEGTRDSSKAHGPIRLHPREPRRNRQRPRNHLGPVGGDARCSDHPGRDPRRARAESIAMGAVAYTSTRARRRLYLSQALQERREMKEIPQTERDEVREILTGGGYRDADLEEIVERICRNPTAELEFMMSFELQLSPVEASAPS